MSAEDLDKLFRDKLKNRPVAPSNDAWERLQARMQPPVQQEEKKPVMWYYSAAAAVTLLVSVSLWTLNSGNDALQPQGTVATVQEKVISAPAATPAETEMEKIKKEVETQATFTQPAASTTQRAVAAVNAPVNRRAETNTSSYQKQAKTSAPEQEEIKATQNPEPEMMAAVTHSKKAQETATTTQEAPLEIIVKLDSNQGRALAQATPQVEAEVETETDRGSGRVLKGILKQVKNLRDGEKINLSELGIAKHTYALETRIGNKTISKTIEL